MKELIQLWENIKDFLSRKRIEKDPWNMSVNLYNISQIVTVERGCFAMMFTNTGADTVTVNGITLFPGTVGSILGDSVSLGGHKNDVYKGNLKISFATVVNPQIQITQLFYMEN